MADLALEFPTPDGLAAGRRQLVQALLAHEHWQADATTHLLLAQGHGLPELFDQVLQPMLDQHVERVRRGQESQASLQALQHAMVRLIARLPMSTAGRARGSAVFVLHGRDDSLLCGYMFATALEHQGYDSYVLGEIPLSQVAPFVQARVRHPRVVVLVVDEPPADTMRLRGDLRRLRADVPGVRVVLCGHAARKELTLPAAIGADGAADDVASGVRLVDTLLQPLTHREIETLRLVAGGRTNRQIATALGIAPSTVKSSLDRVFEKLSTPDRAAAAAVAVRRGWID